MFMQNANDSLFVKRFEIYSEYNFTFSKIQKNLKVNEKLLEIMIERFQ